MQVINSLLMFIRNFLGSLNGFFNWLNTPFITSDNMPLGFAILERLGLDIEWIYGLTPLVLLSSSLIVLLSFILIVKLVGMILSAIPFA